MKGYWFNGMPLETEFQLRKARELSRRGNDDAALIFFKQAVLIAPALSGAYKETADCLLRLDRFDEAEMYYKKSMNGNEQGGIRARSEKSPT